MVELPLGEEEHVFGFGLQLKSHDQRGLKKTARVNADPVADTGDTHAPVPFFVTTDSAWHTYHVLLEEGVREMEEAQAGNLKEFSTKLVAAALKLPGAKEIAYRPGLSGDYRAVFARGIHSAPGLSFRFAGEIPPQAALFADGEHRGTVPRDGGRTLRGR